MIFVNFWDISGNYNRHIQSLESKFLESKGKKNRKKVKREKYASFLTTFLAPALLLDLYLTILFFLFWQVMTVYECFFDFFTQRFED